MMPPRPARASASTRIALHSCLAAAAKSACRSCPNPKWPTRFSIAWRRCLDAKDALRRYLEQRREMGESELVLDTMSIDEAMRLLAGGRKSEVGSRKHVTAAEGPPAHVLEGPPPVEREVEESQLGG